MEISAWIEEAGMTSVPTLLALRSLLFALKSIEGALRHYNDLEKLILSLATNIATAYVKLTLLAAGYLLDIIMRM